MVLWSGLGSVSYYDFKHIPRSALGRFICESKSCVNTWMAIVDVVENHG